ncbi:MAG: alpha/beta hydrolase family protein [Burkholderiales bacterium]
MKAAVWYPTTAPESNYQYASDTASTLALGAAPTTCARFPLVVFSHGLGGCGTQSLFFTESLARRGYVVVAPDHDDRLCSVDGTPPSGTTVTEPAVTDPGSWTDTTYATRREDVHEVLDAMLSSSPWSAQVDPDRIGLAGHSLGGYTAIGVAGAWTSWKDARVKAVLGLSPYILPFLQKNLLGNVVTPLMYQGAQFDIFITPSLEGPTGAYAAAHPPKALVELFLGSHFEWTNVVCLSTQTIANCLQTRSNAALINAYGFAFFDVYLKGRDNGLLAGPGAGLRVYEKQLN